MRFMYVEKSVAKGVLRASELCAVMRQRLLEVSWLSQFALMQTELQLNLMFSPYLG